MYMRRLLVVSVLVAMPLLGAVVQARDTCQHALPAALVQILEKKYPGWNLVNFEDLGPTGADFFRKDAELYPEKNPTDCPGATRVDLYGDGREVYAFVLKQESITRVKSKLLLSEINKSKHWTIRTLMDDECGCAVRTIPSGEHRDVIKGNTIKSQGEAVLYIKYEAYTIVFAWTGEKIERVYVQD